MSPASGTTEPPRLPPLMQSRHFYEEEAEPWLARACYTGLPYLQSSLMAAVVGLVYLQQLKASTPNLGMGLELNVILAVVLGGTCLGGRFGNLIGALLGAIFVVALLNICNLAGVVFFIQQVILGAALLVAAGASRGYYALAELLYRRTQTRPRYWPAGHEQGHSES